AHPGTEVTVIDLFNDGNSTEPMWKQVEGFGKVIQKNHGEVSRGSPSSVLLSRSNLQRSSFHSPKPQRAQLHCAVFTAGWAVWTGCLAQIFSPFCKRISVPFMLQKIFTGESFNLQLLDPHHRKQYLEYSNFLPLLNGEWRKNFLRIKKLVLIGGPDDNVITPWQSFFGFYNHNEVVVEMKEQTFYKDDTFGLKTLDTRGDISVCSQPGVKHVEWHSNEKVFDKCIK
uniref:palmitoyl-CoA hydrolase n=1 Tax=Oryzias latipes TaxID=8090 RepID=A0A3P9MAV6_ORYLA